MKIGVVGLLEIRMKETGGRTWGIKSKGMVEGLDFMFTLPGNHLWVWKGEVWDSLVLTLSGKPPRCRPSAVELAMDITHRYIPAGGRAV